MVRKLSSEELYWKFDKISNIFKKINFQINLNKNNEFDSYKFEIFIQKHQLRMLNLGIGIKQIGFNMFAISSSKKMLITALERTVSNIAINENIPCDLILLYDFKDKNCLFSLSLSPGLGSILKRTYENLIDLIRIEISSVFESKKYIAKFNTFQNNFQFQIDELLSSIKEEGFLKGFFFNQEFINNQIQFTSFNGYFSSKFNLSFEQLNNYFKNEIRKNKIFLNCQLENYFNYFRYMKQESVDLIQNFTIKTTNGRLNLIFKEIKNCWEFDLNIKIHLTEIKKDILSELKAFIKIYFFNNYEEFLEKKNYKYDNRQHGKINFVKHCDIKNAFLDIFNLNLDKYRVQLLVDNAKCRGVPVKYEKRPTFSNLFGCLKQQFAKEENQETTLINIGSLCRANGGYLILDADEVMQDTRCWENLKQILSNQLIEFAELFKLDNLVENIKIKPIGLQTKIILVGSYEAYSSLLKKDSEFLNLFKILINFEDEIECNDCNIRYYIKFLNYLCLKEKLKYLDNSGIEKIIKYSSILAGCEKKLSIRIDEIVDLIREANFLTEEDGSMLICDRHIQEAVKASRNREFAFYEYTIEDICNDRILIETSGSAIGQVNILTIREFEKFVFGIPARVTCSVSSGNGDFIDIEHETEQGGNLHKRGRLTMLGFFANCFGRDVSVANLNTVLCVEQVFGEIDGDSATLAETCAFFSALANIPILQHMAITGSMDQRGNIQAIGNVNEKIEGFFRVCEAKRKKNTLKIPNIVIIPYVNKFELNLNKDIVNACNNGIFEIYSAKNFQEVMQLITGHKWNTGNKSIKKEIIKTLKHFKSIK